MCSTSELPRLEIRREGVCNYYRTYRPVKYLGEGALSDLLNNYRNLGEMYDCVVTVSGGKGSAFVWHQLQEIYGMRVLAFNYDSGLVHEQAKENLRKMTRKLGTKLVTLRSSRSIQKRVLKKVWFLGVGNLIVFQLSVMAV